MKIGFLSHLDMNLYFFRLPIMIELVNAGHEVYAIMPKGKYSDKFSQYNIKTIFYNIDRQSLNIFKEAKSIYSIYKNIKMLHLDILSSFMLKPNIYASISIFALKFSKINTRLVCAVTGLGSFYIDNSLKSSTMKHFTQRLYKLSFLIANKVIFQNSDDLDLFIQKSIVKKSKAILIKSSGIDTENFNQNSTNKNITLDIKNKLDIKKDEIIILMIARLIIHKGVVEYIKSSNILKNKYPHTRFLLIGDIDYGNHFSIDKSLLKNKNIEFLGHRDDIKEYISICDIFVLPSYREGVPKTLLEASAMSKPIVTTNTVGCKEVVRDKFNGFLVKIKDEVSLAKAIEYLILDKEKRELFGERSLELVKKEFDIKHVVKSYIGVYKSIL